MKPTTPEDATNPSDPATAEAAAPPTDHPTPPNGAPVLPADAGESPDGSATPASPRTDVPAPADEATGAMAEVDLPAPAGRTAAPETTPAGEVPSGASTPWAPSAAPEPAWAATSAVDAPEVAPDGRIITPGTADGEPPTPDARRPRPRLIWLAAAVPLLVVMLLGAAWAVAGGRDQSRVAANVELGGTEVGRLNGDDLGRKIDELAAQRAGRPVTLKTSKGDIRTDSATLGLKVDREASIDAAMEVGRGGFGLFRPFSWAASFLSTREASLIWTVDRSVLDAALPAVEGDKIVPVLEPSLVATGATLSVAPGHPGDALSPDALADRLAGAAGTDDAEVTLEVEQASTDPVHSDEEVQALADQGNQLLQKPLTATFGLDSRAIPAATVASWLRAVPDPAGKLALQVDDGAVDAALHGLYDGLTSQPRDAGFTVQAGAPVLIPGAPGVACCGPAQGAKVLAALQGPGTVAFEPILTPPAFSTEQAQALGIKEEVGQPTHFGPTTQHQCCQPRVTNIHLIADKVRGHVVKPGETFSLNGFVGERKAGDGYVEAPMIENGVDVHAIGGGVSQFATTTMNAAFYAGLDIVEYQSHSLYFTRYPRGREATVSWKKPDLRIKNTTPYGVLIWPEYTETSLTVHLYSTHYVDVVDLPTTDSPQGACTRVTTPRVRTYLDGRVANDSVFAIYRPAEGINC